MASCSIPANTNFSSQPKKLFPLIVQSTVVNKYAEHALLFISACGNGGEVM
jgi:hypothetical protein